MRHSFTGPLFLLFHPLPPCWLFWAYATRRKKGKRRHGPWIIFSPLLCFYSICVRRAVIWTGRIHNRWLADDEEWLWFKALHTVHTRTICVRFSLFCPALLVNSSFISGHFGPTVITYTFCIMAHAFVYSIRFVFVYMWRQQISHRFQIVEDPLLFSLKICVLPRIYLRYLLQEWRCSIFDDDVSSSHGRRWKHFWGPIALNNKIVPMLIFLNIWLELFCNPSMYPFKEINAVICGYFYSHFLYDVL